MNPGKIKALATQLKYTIDPKDKNVLVYPQYISACPNKLTSREQLKTLKDFVGDGKKVVLKEPTYEILYSPDKDYSNVFVKIKIIDPKIQPEELRVDANKQFIILKKFMEKLCGMRRYKAKSNEQPSEKPPGTEPKEEPAASKPVV